MEGSARVRTVFGVRCRFPRDGASVATRHMPMSGDPHMDRAALRPSVTLWAVIPRGTHAEGHGSGPSRRNQLECFQMAFQGGFSGGVPLLILIVLARENHR